MSFTFWLLKKLGFHSASLDSFSWPFFWTWARIWWTIIWYLSILTKNVSPIVFLSNKLEPHQGSESKMIFEGSYSLNCCAMIETFKISRLHFIFGCHLSRIQMLNDKSCFGVVSYSDQPTNGGIKTRVFFVEAALK